MNIKNVIYSLTQAGNKDEVSVESDLKEYCWNNISIGLTDNQVEMLQPSLLFSILSRGWGLNRDGGLIELLQYLVLGCCSIFQILIALDQKYVILHTHFQAL